MFFVRVILIVSAFLYIGCDSNKNDSANSGISIDNELVRKTQSDLLAFEQVFALGQVFNGHPQADKNLLRSAINKSRAGVLILDRFYLGQVPLESANLAYTELSSALYLLEKVQLLEGDAEEVNEIFDNVRLLRHELAIQLNKDTDSWVLYKHNFADGIEPEFLAPEGKDKYGSKKWITNFQIDLPKAKIGANSGYAWLVSRPLDISKVMNPAFRFHASYLVTGTDSKTTLFEVVETVFKTYIILDLQPGESLEDLPEDRKIRVYYTPDEVPKAQDFHDQWLPFRSLESYKDHKVSIGFLFDTRKIEETQYYSWDIFDFEVVGAGPLKIEPYVYNPILSAGLGDFNSLTAIFAGPEWSAAESGLSVESNGNTEVALISPLFYATPLPKQESTLALTIEDTLNLADDSSVAEILISTNYIPGLPFNKSNQNWIRLDKSSLGDRHQTYDLTEYINKDFYVAFYFKSQNALDKWTISNFLLSGDGARLNALTFKAKDANFIDKVNTLRQFDFTKENILDELQVVYESQDKTPFWKPSRDGDGLRVSGYAKDGNMTGLSRLVVPGATLSSGSNLVRLVHKIGFMRDPGDHLNAYVRLSGSTDKWESIQFGKDDLNKETNKKFQETNWAPLPNKFAGQTVDISFTYHASDSQAPEWIIQSVALGEGVSE